MPNSIPYFDTLRTQSDFTRNQKIVRSQLELGMKNKKLRKQVRIQYLISKNYLRVLG